MIAKIIIKNWPEYMSRNPKGLILLLLLFFVFNFCFCNTLISNT